MPVATRSGSVREQPTEAELREIERQRAYIGVLPTKTTPVKPKLPKIYEYITKPTASITPPTDSRKFVNVSTSKTASIQFYKQIGYPEYAGKYEPFTIPEGYKVGMITKTEKDLQVSFESTKPKLWHEYLSPLSGEPRSVAEGIQKFLFGSKEGPQPLGGYGGVSTIGLLGVKEEARLYEATVGKIEEATGKPSPRSDIMTSQQLALEWGLRVGTYGIVKYGIPKIEKRATSWLTKQYLEKGSLAWKGKTERLVMKVTGAKPHLATEIVMGVTPPPISEPLSITKFEINIMERQAQQEALSYFWKSPTVKTSEMWITHLPPKISTRASQWAAGTWVKHITGGLPYTQQIETELAKPLTPTALYIPTLEPFKLVTSHGSQVALILVGFKFTPSWFTQYRKQKHAPMYVPTMVTPKTPSIIQERQQRMKQIQKTWLFEPTVPKLKGLSKLRPFTTTTTIEKQAEKQVATTIQIPSMKEITQQITRQIQIPKITMTTPTFPTFSLPQFYKPGGGGRGFGSKKSLYARWFEKQQRIKTPEQMLKTFFGTSTRTKRKPKKVRRKHK